MFGVRLRGFVALVAVFVTCLVLGVLMPVTPALGAQGDANGGSENAPTLSGSPSAASLQSSVPLKGLAGAGTGAPRFAGADRYATNAAVVGAVAPAGGATLIIATGDDYPDALVAGALSAKLQAPLLLVAKDSIAQVGLDVLASLRPSKLVIVGGQAAVSGQLGAQLAQMTGAEVTRLAGVDRFETAARVADLWDSATTVFVATGSGYADALAATPAAASQGNAPLLLVQADQIPKASADALTRLKPTSVVVVGGPSVVSDQASAQVQAVVPQVTMSRVFGADRYGTAYALANTYMPNAGGVVLATGTNFPDALSAAPLAIANARPILMVPGSKCMSSPYIDYLEARGGVQAAVLLGGDAALGDNPTQLCAATAERRAEAKALEASGCAPGQAGAREALPADQRPWCPGGDYYRPVVDVLPVRTQEVLGEHHAGVKVAAVQRRLGIGGLAGMWKKTLSAAVIQFQQNVGLPVNGLVDKATWDALNTGIDWQADTWKAGVSVAPNATRAQRIEAMIAFASAQVGSPYVWGGAGPYAQGYDCSGLVLQGLHVAGVDPQPYEMRLFGHHTTTTERMIHDPRFQKLDYSQRQRGDLIFWTDRAGVTVHVAIYLGAAPGASGAEEILEATGPSVGVNPLLGAHKNWQLHPQIIRPFQTG